MNESRRMIALVAAAAMVLTLTAPALAQAPSSSPSSQELAEVMQQIRILNESLKETRAELEESRTEIRQLRSTVASLTASLPATSEALPSDQAQTTAQASSSSRAVTQDDLQVLSARVEEQHQTKVESASKFRVKLSGMILLNGFSNFGQVDSIDLPTIALPSRPKASGGGIGGTMRQSTIGVTGYGPELLGAHTSGDLQMDFFGGFPSGYAGVTSGVARLRLARLRMDWKETSLIGGLDTPFFSPNSPTSYATVGEPGLSAAGNLWTWTPSVRVAHRFDYESFSWKIEAGLFDPAGYGGYTPPVRYATAGENSRQPAYAVRFSGNHGNSDRRLAIGVAGLYTPQRYYDGSSVHGAGLMVDWQIPVATHFEASGEFFTGKGLQAFGGTPYSPVSSQDSLHYAYVTAPLLGGIGEVGGWSQLKFKVDAKNEFNIAAGYGGYNSAGMRDAFGYDPYVGSVPSINESLLVNYIIKPRSNLLLSAEYRRLRTTYIDRSPANADVVGIAAGFLF